MPLTRRITFKTTFHESRRIHVPKIMRVQFAIETCEVLKVTLSVVGSVSMRESFLAKMHKNGCVSVPPLVEALLKRSEPNLDGCPIEVVLEPT